VINRMSVGSIIKFKVTVIDELQQGRNTHGEAVISSVPISSVS